MSSPRKDRIIGPSLRPDDVAPATGIGPAIPVELFQSKMVRDAENVEEEVVDLSTIGPLIPGQEFGDELRHLRSDGVSIRGFFIFVLCHRCKFDLFCLFCLLRFRLFVLLACGQSRALHSSNSSI
ncbi:unnamed protein product [Echinostoma caproni]|uniref:Reverse transcriptase domain-containing protein n=1 Tax=Echinostoma caproni TaxID=27848 RepID=A0A183A1K8_9TREM|nr:unnamed protein product [Echinostoma caproni]